MVPPLKDGKDLEQRTLQAFEDIRQIKINTGCLVFWVFLALCLRIAGCV